MLCLLDNSVRGKHAAAAAAHAFGKACTSQQQARSTPRRVQQMEYVMNYPSAQWQVGRWSQLQAFGLLGMWHFPV